MKTTHGAYTAAMASVTRLIDPLSIVRNNIKTIYAAGPLVEDEETLAILLQVRDMLEPIEDVLDKATEKAAEAAEAYGRALKRQGREASPAATKVIRLRRNAP